MAAEDFAGICLIRELGVASFPVGTLPRGKSPLFLHRGPAQDGQHGCEQHGEYHHDDGGFMQILCSPDVAGAVRYFSNGADQIGGSVAQRNGKVDKNGNKPRSARPRSDKIGAEMQGQCESLVEQPDTQVPAGVVGQRDAEIAAAVVPYPRTVERPADPSPRPTARPRRRQ